MERIICVTLLCGFLVVAEAYISGSACPTRLSKCKCERNTVNCSRRANLWLPEDLIFDLGVTYFYFDRTNLTEIKAGHFRNFPDMTHLSLRENQITSIEEGSLDKNTKMIQIDLSYNLLTSLPLTLFKRMIQLKNVYLSHNKLKRIDSVHFMHLTTLQDVRLQNNALTSVGRDTFRNSPKLNHLYLEYNLLEIPEKDWFVAFNTTAEKYEVYLDQNPWSCDCRMRDFYLWGSKHPWFMHHDGEGVSVPKCSEPDRLSGTTLAKVPSVDDLICESVSLTPQTLEVIEIRTVEGQVVMIFCNASGIPRPQVEIRDAKDNLMTSSKGTAVHRISEVAQKDAGLYTCHASGYDSKGEISSMSIRILLTVYQSAGHVVTTIVLSLVFVGAGLALGVWYYKKKWGKRSAYGRLPQSTAYYERKDIENAARANAESRHVPPGGPPAPTNVSNPYHDETESGDDEDEEAVLEFSKDTEFLV